MKDKLKAALEHLDYGMTHEGTEELRALAPDMPALNGVIEKLDLSMNDEASEELRHIIDAM